VAKHSEPKIQRCPLWPLLLMICNHTGMGM
jgi:hypothetical protein